AGVRGPPGVQGLVEGEADAHGADVAALLNNDPSGDTAGDSRHEGGQLPVLQRLDVRPESVRSCRHPNAPLWKRPASGEDENAVLPRFRAPTAPGRRTGPASRGAPPPRAPASRPRRRGAGAAGRRNGRRPGGGSGRAAAASAGPARRTAASPPAPPPAARPPPTRPSAGAGTPPSAPPPRPRTAAGVAARRRAGGRRRSRRAAT